MYNRMKCIYHSRPLLARVVLKGTILTNFAVSLTACAVAPLEQNITMAQTHDEDRAAILSNGERWITFYQTGEIEKMRDLYEEDAWVMPNGSHQLRGADETVAYFARNRKSGNEVTFRFEPENLVIESDRAYLVTQYWMQITSPDGSLSEHKGRTFLVYRKGSDGMWRVWRDMDNSAPDVTLGIGK